MSTPSVSPVDDAVEQAVDPRPQVVRSRGSRLLTLGLLLALVAWMGAAWWTAPRAADVAQLERQVAAGEVVLFHRTDQVERTGLWRAMTSFSTDRNGGYLLWRSTNGQVFYTAPDLPVEPEDLPTTGRLDRSGAETDALERQLLGAGINHGWRDHGLVQLGPLVLAIAGLLTLRAGADPRRGTRWFWFFVGAIPGGIGMLAWLLAERVWPRRREPTARSRWIGAQGLGVYLVVTWLVVASTLWLRGPLGTFLVP